MDLSILQWINENLHGSDFFNKFVAVFTLLGEYGAVWIVIGLLLLCFKKTRKGGLIYAVCLIIDAVFVNLIIKTVVARPRPFVEDEGLLDFILGIGMKLPGEYSFPSGHAALGFTAATALTLIFGRKWAYSYILAVLLSLSRIFLCVHYPSDVLCGMILGIVFAFTGYYLCKWIGQLIAKKSRK